MEPKYINQSAATDSNTKDEIISVQRDVDVDSKACLFESIIYITTKQVNT
jgi:hypothetical protein